MANKKGIELGKTVLKDQFFEEFVSQYGTLTGGARYGPYTSANYIKKKWRSTFCIKKKTKSGAIIADVHLYDEPQEEKTPCHLCNPVMDAGENIDIHIGENIESPHAESPTRMDNYSTIAPTRTENDKKETQTLRYCPSCSRTVRNVKRHLQENCSIHKGLQCPHCLSMFSASTLKRHVNDRINKETGEIIVYGCAKNMERKQSVFSKKLVHGRVTCQLCGKNLKKRSMYNHMKKLHSQYPWIKSQILSSIQQEGRESVNSTPSQYTSTCTGQKSGSPKIYVTRKQMSEACREAQLQLNISEAQRHSLKENNINLTQVQMIQSGIQFAQRLGIHLNTSNVSIPMDGNCLWSCISHSFQPDLSGVALHKDATRLRMIAVGRAVAAISHLNIEGLEDLQAAAADTSNRDPVNREQLKEILTDYINDGTYQGPMGDILPQVASSFLQTPILIIEISKGLPAGYFLNPKNIFNMESKYDTPIVIVRQAQHYEVLIVPEESRKPLQNAYFGYLQESPAAIVYPTISTSPACTSKNKRDISMEKSPKHILTPPKPDIGDRMRLLSTLKELDQQEKARIQCLIDDLDEIYVKTPSDIKEMEKLEHDIEQILVVVRRWAKKKKGFNYRTDATERFGAPRESSSVDTYVKMIGNKILPFLRYHSFSEIQDFAVTDLLAFGTPKFARIHEHMVIACNQDVGNTAALKKVLLHSWQVLIQAIQLELRNFVDIVGDTYITNLNTWYNCLKQDIGEGVSHMSVRAIRAQVENRELKRQKKETQHIPMDRAISIWLESTIRSDQEKELFNMSTLIRSGENVLVSPSTYKKLSEFVQTELSIYFPVRIGATGKLKVRTIVRSQPAWYNINEKNRPVTILPNTACEHQKNNGGSVSAKIGKAENGNICCEDAVLPTCFLVCNDEDKGGKTDSWLAISTEGFNLLSAFLTVRDTYFKKFPSEHVTDIEGICPVFLSSKGKLPRATSDFKLNLFNSAVYGDNNQMVVTPQDLRSWNTTYLSNHEDEDIRAMRGTVTGNSDIIFNRHYNLGRRAGILNALITSLNYHCSQKAPVNWTHEEEERQKRDNIAIELANEAVLLRNDGVDRTNRQQPVHRHIRKHFSMELETLYPGLWKRGGKKGCGRDGGLTEMVWVKKVITLLGHEDAENLRSLIFQQYRGEENPAKRRWSGARSHFYTINNYNDPKIEIQQNCPLTATVKLFYQSAKSQNCNNKLNHNHKDISSDSILSDDST